MYSKIELLALIKNHNKCNVEKIRNSDKLKKHQLYDVCKKYKIISDESQGDVETDEDKLDNICKRDLLKDIEIYFLKQNKNVPMDIFKMRKKNLIEYMVLNGVIHYSKKLIEKEIRLFQLKNIIIYNIMRYDNVDVTKLDDDNLEEYIQKNNLDTDIICLQQYAVLLNTLYSAVDEFCKKTNANIEKDKIKSLPKILETLKYICMNN